MAVKKSKQKKNKPAKHVDDDAKQISTGPLTEHMAEKKDTDAPSGSTDKGKQKKKKKPVKDMNNAKRISTDPLSKSKAEQMDADAVSDTVEKRKKKKSKPPKNADDDAERGGTGMLTRDTAEHEDADAHTLSEVVEERKKPVNHFRRGQLRRKTKLRIDVEAAQRTAELGPEEFPEWDLEEVPGGADSIHSYTGTTLEW